MIKKIFLLLLFLIIFIIELLINTWFNSYSMWVVALAFFTGQVFNEVANTVIKK